MKTKNLILIALLVLAIGAAYGGRRWWRARRELVTLDVRNAPLSEVLQKIEKQTWKRIFSEKEIQGRITLHIKDRPLNDVLDRLAEQVGARWSTVYAVYDASPTLAHLESALAGDGKFERAGWIRIAPEMPAPNPAEANDGPAPLRHQLGPNGPGPGQRRMMMVRAGPNGPVMFSGGPDGQVEMWSPEELLLASALKPLLGDEHTQAATSQTAAETARKVKGQWTTLVAFRKSNMGIGMGLMPRGDPGGPGRAKPDPNERFARLTPAQRVQRARERLELRGK